MQYFRSMLAGSFLSAVVVNAVITLPATAILTLSLASPTNAMPFCSSASADSDGDGWGWENNASCVVNSSSGNTSTSGGSTGSTSTSAATTSTGNPICSSSASDNDGDGYGWENNRTCVVISRSSISSSISSSSNSNNNSASVASTGGPICSSRSSDSDGDGWGWENGRSCIISSSSASASNSNAASASTRQVSSQQTGGNPVCASSASDSDNDGYGFENGVSCIVTAASRSASSVTSTAAAPPPVAAAVSGITDTGDPVCLTDASDHNNTSFGYENNRTCRVVPGVTATRNRPLLNQRSCIPWLEIGYGNYRLQNNVWNSSAVFNNNWSQCIELTGGSGNYVAKWDYNWLGRNQGNEYAVKSYPQVYYGRKTQYNLSGSVAETGLPARADSLPRFRVEYDYSETGIVERNVAFESFFHTSCNAEEHNKQYEMMVWVGKPAIRTPGTQVTTATLSGQQWDVFINPSLGWAYVAFVARNPSTRGTLNWNDFVDWSRDRGPSFGVPAMARNACMGAIELGTETFWGSGTFTLNRFRVNRG